MSARSYKLAQEPTRRGWAQAVQAQPAAPVGPHLAVRGVFVPHPAGEGLHYLVWVVDHVHSGRRAYGHYMRSMHAGFAPVVRMAKALLTMPIKWSEPLPDLSLEGGWAFIQWAEKEVSERRSRVTWQRWAEETSDA